MPQPTLADFFDWVLAHRKTSGCVLLSMLAIGFYGYYPFIASEWPRLETWQRAAIWIGDVTAVLLVVHWAMRDSTLPTSFDAEQRRNLLRRMKWISLSLLLSLTADIAGTAYGIYAEYLSSRRTVKTVAQVTDVTGVVWRPVKHFKLKLQFRDAAGRMHQGLIVFTRKKGGVYPFWVEGDTRKALAAGRRRFPIEIKYDPQHPARVWAADEPWNRGHALAYAFALVHMFQLVIVGSLCGSVLFAKSIKPNSASAELLPLVALAAEAFVIVIFGPLLRSRGF